MSNPSRLPPGNIAGLPSALADRLCRAAGGDSFLAEAFGEVIEIWLRRLRSAAVETRRTSGSDEDCVPLLKALGFAELVRVMTSREQAVLLALLPQLHRIAHHGPSLAEAFQCWIGVPVRYLGHEPHHQVIPADDCSRLSKAHSQLGTNFVLGGKFVEHRSTLAFEIDLHANGSLERVVLGGWATSVYHQLAPTEKLIVLAEHLISASLRIEWRWLGPAREEPACWRLGVFTFSRLGHSTRLAQP